MVETTLGKSRLSFILYFRRVRTFLFQISWRSQICVNQNVLQGGDYLLIKKLNWTSSSALVSVFCWKPSFRKGLELIDINVDKEFSYPEIRWCSRSFYNCLRLLWHHHRSVGTRKTSHWNCRRRHCRDYSCQVISTEINFEIESFLQLT